jgi:hypothetical protein
VALKRRCDVSARGIRFEIISGRGFAMKEKERKTSQIVVQITPTERAWLEQEAEQRGLDLSSFVRMTFKQVRVQPNTRKSCAILQCEPNACDADQERSALGSHTCGTITHS